MILINNMCETSNEKHTPLILSLFFIIYWYSNELRRSEHDWKKKHSRPLLHEGRRFPKRSKILWPTSSKTQQKSTPFQYATKYYPTSTTTVQYSVHHTSGQCRDVETSGRKYKFVKSNSESELRWGIRQRRRGYQKAVLQFIFSWKQ